MEYIWFTFDKAHMLFEVNTHRKCPTLHVNSHSPGFSLYIYIYLRIKYFKMSSRPTIAQLEALTEFLESNPGLAKGLLRTAQAKQENKRKWINISVTLNAMGGVAKDGVGWAKYWTEKKCALKRLCAQHAQSARQTGGGTEPLTRFSDMDLRMIAVMGGPSFAQGDNQFAVDPFPHSNQNTQAPTSLSQISGTSISVALDPDTPSTSAAANTGVTQGQENATVPPTSPQPTRSIRRSPRHHRPPSTSSQSRSRSHIQSRLDIEMERFAEIEQRRVQAEAITSGALAEAVTRIDGCAAALNNCAEAIRCGFLQIAEAIREVGSAPNQK